MLSLVALFGCAKGVEITEGVDVVIVQLEPEPDAGGPDASSIPVATVELVMPATTPPASPPPLPEQPAAAGGESSLDAGAGDAGETPAPPADAGG